MSQIITFGGSGSSTGTVKSLTGDSGGAVSPDAAGNITLAGDGVFLVATGTPASNKITIDVSDNAKFTAMKSWVGTFLDQVSGSVSSDGTTVTVAVEKAGGGDITVNFSTGFYDWDTSPAATATLTAGTDEVPILNYVYFLESSKALTVSTSDWPSAEHAKIGKILVPSASFVSTDNVYMLHSQSDEAYSASRASGHIEHIGSWIRSQNATWEDGVAQTLTIMTNSGAKDNVVFTSTSGTVLQLHDHTFPAFSGTPDYYVVNDFTVKYNKISDINEIEADSNNSTLVNRYYTLVIWGASSGNGTSEKLFINLPSGSYNKASYAKKDANKKANYSIPSEFKGSGFLIASYVFHYDSADGGTWTNEQFTDLRGLFPSITAGGSTDYPSEFDDSTFRINDDGDPTKQLAFESATITTGTTRTITMCDNDLDLTDPVFYGTVSTHENFALPATTATTGQLTINGSAVLHTSGTNSIYLGGAGSTAASGSSNIGIGINAISGITTGTENIAIGENAGNAVTHYAKDNVFIGTDVAGTSFAGGNASRGTVIGNGAAKNASRNSESIVALGFRAATSISGRHQFNTLIGSYAFYLAGGTDSTTDCPIYNTLVGGRAGASMAGDHIIYNTLIGYKAGYNYTDEESSNICIGNNGVLGDDNTIRIGNSGTGDDQQDTTFIAGIYNTTPSGGNSGTVIIDSDGQLGSTTAVVGYSQFNAQTGTSYTLVLTDVNKIITFNNASAISATVPPNSSVAFPVGTQIGIIQKGVGTLTLVAGTGVTINSDSSKLDISNQYCSALLTYEGSDVWYLTGSLA